DEALLDAQHPSYLRAQPSPTAVTLAGRYIRTGIQHILSGPDHVLFVIGLLLLGQSLVAVLTTITAFTLAHSITLTLAALGILVPSARIVEPLIALSIVAIAVENLRPHRATGGRDYRPAVAFAFGLVHGFGFAGALADAGLIGRSLWLALGAFNVGVEIGQGAIVLVTVPMLAWCARHYAAQWRAVLVAGSLAIGLAGSYWFVVRL
ncbi:MAG: HupE/UreJ family protein, partial [Acidobacteriota bacterium]